MENTQTLSSIASKIMLPESPAAHEDALQPEPEEFAAMELDDYEIEMALREQRKKKYFKQANDAYWQQKVMAEETYRTYTAEELGKELKRTPVASFPSPAGDRAGIPAEALAQAGVRYFKIDEANREIVKLLCYYFTNDPRFEQAGYSLSKGLILQGPVGVGKSLLLELLQQNQKQSYRLVSALDVVSAYTNQDEQAKKQGHNPLDVYAANAIAPLGGNPFGHRAIGYCFDDLGTESQDAMYFGTRNNCMEEVLWKRYKAKLFTSTHITTNLALEDIGRLYGPRIYDRLFEMFNHITWPSTAKSRR